MNKVTLICTTWNPNAELLNKMLQSARGFDEIVLHIDCDTKNYPDIDGGLLNCPFRLEVNHEHLGIGQAYNMLIERTATEWICCMCDDDYFDKAELDVALTYLKNDVIKEDVLHFPVHVFRGCNISPLGSF